MEFYTSNVFNGSPAGQAIGGITMSAQTTDAITTFLEGLTRPQFTLGVSRVGTGAGTVTSSPVGIDCGSTCTANYAAGTDVTLSATPAPGATFAGWSGACSGTDSCTLSMTQNRNVIATFNASVGNDNFANRILLSGSAVSTSGRNVGATKEAGEPNHNGNTGGASVWWTWTVPATGEVIVHTQGSTFDTLLAIYTGMTEAPSVVSLIGVASDDDSGGGLTSLLTFTAQANTTYQIAVDGSGGDVGDISLSLTTVADTMPDPFTFTDRTNVALSTVIVSNVITISGINAPASITVMGGEYALNGGAFTPGPGTVTNGASVQVRHTSAATFATAINTTLTIGGVSDTFTSTTPPALRINDVTKAEGNTGTTAFIFTVTLSNPSTSPVLVTYGTANGTATAPGDYTTKTGTLTFPANSTAPQTVTIAVTGDTVRELNETFFVNLTNAVGATIVDPDFRGIGMILNDDGPLLRISDVTSTEGNVGTKNFVFTVTLLPAAANTVTVNCVTANGTATAPSDYTAVNIPLTFTPGQTSKTCTVPVIGNTVVEPNETFFVNLTNAVGATIVDPDFRGIGMILNDDGPLLRTSDVTSTEGNVGTKNFVTVTLSPAAASTVTVNCVTANGTATMPSDYTAVNVPLSFSAGQASKTCTVPVIGNTVVEPNETFVVNLSGSVGASIFDGQGIGTILNQQGKRTITLAKRRG